MSSCSEHIWAIASRSHPEDLHKVEYDPKTNRVFCDCPTYRFHGYCSHIRYFKPLIKTMESLNKMDDKK